MTTKNPLVLSANDVSATIWPNMELKEARPAEVCERISQCQDPEVGVLLKFLYLTGCRISEAIAVKYPKDTNSPRGPSGKDLTLTSYKDTTIALISLRTGKKGGRPRIVPLAVEYEPWAEPILEAFEKAGSDPVFPIPRQTAFRVARKLFEGLGYGIEPYRREKPIPRHLKPFGLHAIRHMRATELMEYYGFSIEDLALYLGWELRFGASVARRYLHLQWQRYVDLLLKSPPPWRGTLTPRIPSARMEEPSKTTKEVEQ